VPYAIEKRSAPMAQPQASPLSVASTAPETKLPSVARESFNPSEPTLLPSPKVAGKNAMLQLTTTPSGASFAIYPGVIANKSAPTLTPLRSGTTPDSIDDIPPGRYTLFFYNDGWPNDRAEISVNAGESVPVDYTFPHGGANITSAPDGAEIFLGTRSLGNTPLSVDLPLGKQKLIARLPDLPERSQMVTIGSATPTIVSFQMNARTRSSRPKATPTPSALDKIGQSLKHVFGGSKSPTPAPRKKR